MNNDLISRSAQHKHLLGPCVAKYPSSFTMGLLAAAQELDAAPAVDAVEVVRCGECKHTETDGCEDPAIYCKKWDRWEMPPDFFCSYGERRIDE